MAIDRLGEGDGAIVQPDVNVFAVDRGFTDLEDTLRVEPER